MEKEFLTTQDAALICGTTQASIYGHLARGHLKKSNVNGWKIYFKREDIIKFKRDYFPNN